MWTRSDERFLRSMGIVADEPAPASPRFVVEPGMNEGEFYVVDRQRRFQNHIFAKWKNTREKAEELAKEMNEKHK